LAPHRQQHSTRPPPRFLYPPSSFPSIALRLLSLSSFCSFLPTLGPTTHQQPLHTPTGVDCAAVGAPDGQYNLTWAQLRSVRGRANRENPDFKNHRSHHSDRTRRSAQCEHQNVQIQRVPPPREPDVDPDVLIASGRNAELRRSVAGRGAAGWQLRRLSVELRQRVVEAVAAARESDDVVGHVQRCFPRHVHTPLRSPSGRPHVQVSGTTNVRITLLLELLLISGVSISTSRRLIPRLEIVVPLNRRGFRATSLHRTYKHLSVTTTTKQQKGGVQGCRGRADVQHSIHQTGWRCTSAERETRLTLRLIGLDGIKKRAEVTHNP